MPENLPGNVLEKLDSLKPSERGEAIAAAAKLLAGGEIKVPATRNSANLHLHTFHSYNSLGFSPSHLVWEAKRQGLALAGSTDFDTLDAMEEMFQAEKSLKIPTTVSLETRTYAEAYATEEVSSPGEPGVMYMMGVGFAALPAAGTPAAAFFASLKSQSRDRNLALLGKINPLLGLAALDYDRDVIPLTPSGNATERHICAALDNRARAVFPEAGKLAEFWAKILGAAPDKAAELIANPGTLQNTIRAKLMKKGGPGYIQPGSGSFPAVEDFFAMMRASRAIPCLAWLDGLSAGEADPDRLVANAIAWGARAVNIIPDRNWNIADAALKKKKLAALEAFVKAAKAPGLPIIAGTEMNSPGQKFVDDFFAPELLPYVEDFMNGAYFLYGHTVLERAFRMGAMSEWAEGTFGSDWKTANAFYAQAGRSARPGADYSPDSLPADPGIKDLFSLLLSKG